MIRLDQTKALSYLCAKAKDYFDRHAYREGAYRDNRFVELCYTVYAHSKIEAGQNGDGSVSSDAGFDIQDFNNVLWALAYEQLGAKLTQYYSDERGIG